MIDDADDGHRYKAGIIFDDVESRAQSHSFLPSLPPMHNFILAAKCLS